MSLLVYKLSEYEHTAEREQYRELCKQLRDFYSKQQDVFLFLANYNVNDCELDGLFIKPDGIIVMEFKNYGGYVIATDNYDWTAGGVCVKGGSRKTVYQQVRFNRAQARNRLEEFMPNPMYVKDIAALVVFHQPIRLDNRLPQKTQTWLHVCDEKTFLAKTRDICSSHTNLPKETMLKLVEKLGLPRECLDEEYSDVSQLSPEPSSTLPLTQVLATSVQTSTTPASPQDLVVPPTISSQRVPVAFFQPSVVPVSPLPKVVTLPQWLDAYIYGQMGAVYSPVRTDMTVIDWNEADLRRYLGTYFPRSYAESYCVFSRFFHDHPEWQVRTNLSVFDFGCGTGGDVLGLLAAIEDALPDVKSVTLKLQDGKNTALRLCERALGEYCAHARLQAVEWKPFPFIIEDVDDLSTMTCVLREQFDIILSFKVLNEYVTKGQMEQVNPYEQFVRQMLPKLRPDGMLLLADVSTLNQTANEWIPKLMERGLGILGSRYRVTSNKGFNEDFIVSHSKRKGDTSKIVWSIIIPNV